VGRLDEALHRYAEATRIRPDFPEAYLNWGTTLAAAGRTSNAIQCFEMALRLRPDFAAARSNLSQLQAARAPKHAFESAPKNP
jgi:protein O-GlcNAc transferase